MSKVYVSDIPSPQLPRHAIFHYVFPPKQKGRPHQWYKTPNETSVGFIDALTGKELMRSEIPARAMWFHTGLKWMGFRKNDVGIIFGQNSLYWIEACWGIQAVEGIVSPVNAAYTPQELAHQILDSGAKLFMTQPDLVPVLEKALDLIPPIVRANLEEKRRIVLMCDTKDKPEGTPYKCMPEIWHQQGVPRQIRSDEEKETAYLCYSSGTTGKAKGVMTSHHNMECQVQALDACFEATDPGQDVFLAVLPFSHIYGLTLTLHLPLIRGIPTVVLPKFDIVQVFQAIQKFRVTFMFAVPPMLIAMMNHPDFGKYKLKSLRGIMLGAAPCDEKLIERFESLFPKIKISSGYGQDEKSVPTCRLTQGYGLTEASPVTHTMTLEEGAKKPGSIGRIIPTMQARVIDPETEKDVEEGQQGELWVRGPSVMSGYWKNEEATRNAFGPGGWLKTGDITRVDEDKYFYIVDRLKELIKYKGYQVPPAELEALLLSHPNIADVGVIGIWDETQNTELPRAYVVPKGGLDNMSDSSKQSMKEEIVNWVQGKVSNHKQMRGGVVLIPIIPKSPSGKILRKDLRVMAKAEAEQGKESVKAKL